MAKGSCHRSTFRDGASTSFFAVLLVTSLLLGLYVASRLPWEVVAWSTVGIWLLVAVVAGLAVPDLAQYALLRRFGARPRRVRWFERGNRPLFAWWTTNHAFTKAQFVVSYGVPVLISSAVLLAYVVRFPTAAPVLGLILPLYLGNLWFALLVLRKPVGPSCNPSNGAYASTSRRSGLLRPEPRRTLLAGGYFIG